VSRPTTLRGTCGELAPIPTLLFELSTFKVFVSTVKSPVTSTPVDVVANFTLAL
jgi:hypothetical protein